MIPTCTDSRGKPSHTLFFVSVAFLAITAKFCIGGFFGLPPVGLSEYGAAFAAIVVPYIGREWIDKSAGVGK